MGKFKPGAFGGLKKETEEHALNNKALEMSSADQEAEIKAGVSYIPMDQLKPNPNNKYSIDEIDRLADMIKLAGGILQDIIVKPADADGLYEITTGERRWRAAKLLKERGEYPVELQGTVPCKIMDPKGFALPLSSESKETFSILVTNQYREKTDADRMMEYQMWKQIFDELRGNGVETLELGDNEEIRISGRKTRELIAEQMNISTGQVSRIEKVERQGSEKTLNTLLSGTLSMGGAEILSELDKTEQDRILETLKERKKIEKSDVKELKEKREPQILIDKSSFQNDLKELQDQVLDEGIRFSQADYKKYQKCIKILKELLQVL